VDTLPAVEFSGRFVGLAMRSSNSSGLATPGPDAGRVARLPSEADAAVARQMQAGDRQAFATFYDRFAPGLFSMIYAILHDQKESEDILQEGLVQMWKGVATCNVKRNSLFTWAVMISRHRAIDRLRSRQQARSTASATDALAAFAPSGRADDGPAESDERERVHAAMAKLDGAQRDAIELAFFAGLTPAQISERLGAPLGAVKAGIRCALLALREALGKGS